MSSPTSDHPKVFISYSHDSRDHMDRVLDLSDRLRGDGIDCCIDQAEVRNTMFIPVLFSPNDSAYIPVMLRSATCYEPNIDEGYGTFYRRLTGQHYTRKPELGKIRPMPPRERKQSTSGRPLAYASAKQNGYDAAREVLEESLELMPTSVHLRHALARLHLWQRRADLAGILYRELAEMPIIEIGLMSEIQSYLRLHPRKNR